MATAKPRPLPHEGYLLLKRDPWQEATCQLIHLKTEERLTLQGSWTMHVSSTGWAYLANSEGQTQWAKDF